MSSGWGALSGSAWGVAGAGEGGDGVGTGERRADVESSDGSGYGPGPPPASTATRPPPPPPPPGVLSAVSIPQAHASKPARGGGGGFSSLFGASAKPVSSAYPHAPGFATADNDVFEGAASPTFGDLNARERDLAEREAKLKKLEDEIRSAGGFRRNNWPICFPIWHHDIQNDIPEDARRMIREIYLSWWGLVLCCSWQFFCATVILGYKPDSNAIPSWFLSIIYWVTCVTLSLWLWYKRIYNAAMNRTTAGYIIFFLFYTVNILWCIWCCIAIPVDAAAWSFSGCATALAAMDVHPFPGVVYFVGFALWVLLSLFNLWCIKDAWLYFRGRGGIKQAKQDAALSVFKAQAGGVGGQQQARQYPAFGANSTMQI